MKAHAPFRFCLGTAFVLLFAAAPAFARGQKNAPQAPVLKPNHTPQARPENRPNAGARGAQNQQHLAQWMENHKNLSLSDQQRALQNEPGFRELPPQTQQRMRDRLTQLNNMNPQQRGRILDRNEAIERLSPPQRQQYRATVQNFVAMPPDRRRLMARAILDLRDMSPGQREQTINSQAFGAQFSPEERQTIHTLLLAEPYPATVSANPGP
jgi:Protein of unknown function (DUF3106)